MGSTTRRRRLIYYGLLIGFIILIRSPLPRIILTDILPGEGGVPERQAREIEKTFRNETNGFLILLAVSVYLDYVSGWSVRRAQQEQFDSLQTTMLDTAKKLQTLTETINTELGKNVDNRVLIRGALSRFHGGDPDTTHLAELVTGNRPVLLDLTTEYSLRDYAPDPTYYELHAKESFRGNLREYVVALVLGADLMDALLAAYPSITDFWTVASTTSFGATRKLLRTSGRVTVNVTGDEGISEVVPCNFAEIHGPEKTAILPSFSRATLGRVCLFRAQLPTAGPAVSYTVESALILPRSNRATFWVADRPTYLREIVFDVRGLAHGVDDIVFEPLPFLAAKAEPASANQTAGRFVIPVYNWLVAGQGVMLIWRDKI